MNAQSTPLRKLHSVKQLSKLYPAWSEASLRWAIYSSGQRHCSLGVIKGNGLETAIFRVGRKVLIDEDLFIQWIETSSLAHLNQKNSA